MIRELHNRTYCEDVRTVRRACSEAILYDEQNKFQDYINFIIEQTGCIREFSNSLSYMLARSEIISQETKRLQGKETELKALKELENKNLQQIKNNVKSSSKILNNLKVSVDVKVQYRKKVTESLAKEKASP